MSFYLPMSVRAVRLALISFTIVLVGGLVFGAAAQANQVVVGVTNLSHHTLYRVGQELGRGSTWVGENGKSLLPDKKIERGSTVGFTALSPTVLIPVQGSASYQLGDTNRVVKMLFKNPVYGANTYTCTPSTLCTVTSSASGVHGLMLVTVTG